MERWLNVCTMGWRWEESPQDRRESVERRGMCLIVVLENVSFGYAAGPPSPGTGMVKTDIEREEGRGVCVVKLSTHRRTYQLVMVRRKIV